MFITGAWKIFRGGSGGNHVGASAPRDPKGCGCLAFALLETAFWGCLLLLNTR